MVLNGLCAISIKHFNGKCKDDRRGSEDFTRRKKSKAYEHKENDNRSGVLKEIHAPEKPMTNDVPDCLKGKMKVRILFRFLKFLINYFIFYPMIIFSYNNI